MTSPAIVSRSKKIATRNSCACPAMLLVVCATSPATISFERKKKSEKIAVAFTIRYTAPAILAARWGGRVSRPSVMVRIVIHVRSYAHRTPRCAGLLRPSLNVHAHHEEPPAGTSAFLCAQVEFGATLFVVNQEASLGA